MARNLIEQSCMKSMLCGEASMPLIDPLFVYYCLQNPVGVINKSTQKALENSHIESLVTLI